MIKRLTLIIALLAAVTLNLTMPPTVYAAPEYYVYYSAGPSTIACGTTSFFANGTTLAWVVPAVADATVIEVQEALDNSVYATYPSGTIFTGTGSSSTGIISDPFPAAVTYPYTWSRTLITYVDGVRYSTSVITFECYGSEEGAMISNTLTNDFTQTTETTTTTVPVPGCNARMNIPSTAVVGTFVTDTPTYWKPGKETGPLVTLEAGKTAWVIGVDETGMYYKILWNCTTLWVPVSSMGPNYDDVWNGTPLPTDVVQ